MRNLLDILLEALLEDVLLWADEDALYTVGRKL